MMKALLPITPRNHRPNGIFSTEDLEEFNSATSSSSDEDSSNDWIDPLWVPDDNVHQYPSPKRSRKSPLSKSDVYILTRPKKKQGLGASLDSLPLDKGTKENKNLPVPRINVTPSSPTTEPRVGKGFLSPLRRRNSTLSRSRNRRMYVRDKSLPQTSREGHRNEEASADPYEGLLTSSGPISRANGRILSSLLREASETVTSRGSPRRDTRHASLCLQRRVDEEGTGAEGENQWKLMPSEDVEEDIDTPNTPTKEKARRLSMLGRKDFNFKSLPSLALFEDPLYAPEATTTTTATSNSRKTRIKNNNHDNNQHVDKENRENNADRRKKQPAERGTIAGKERRNSRREAEWKERRKAQSYDKLVPMLAFHVLQKQQQGGGEEQLKEAEARVYQDPAFVRPQSARERSRALRALLFKKQTPAANTQEQPLTPIPPVNNNM